MKVSYIDSHAHLTSDQVYDEIDAIVAGAVEKGVEKIVNICTDPETLHRGLSVSEKYPHIYNTASATPHDVDTIGEEMFSLTKQKAKERKLKAIGETGLDYHYTHSNPETQKKYLRLYLQLALDSNLPTVIHCREAFSDFFQILDEEYIVGGKHAPGVLHCFTGTVAEAKEVIDRGWYLSLSGIVTFKKSIELKEIAKIVPLNQLLIETDTPYLAPQSMRGKPNRPEYLPEIAQVIADLKGISLEEVARHTKTNAETLFRI